MTIGDNIKRLREQHHETQEELARILDVTPMSVSNWEHGRVAPRMGAIERMAQHWGVPKGRIVDGPDVPPSHMSALTESEQELIALYRDLNQVGRDKLLDLADDMLSSRKYRR